MYYVFRNVELDTLFIKSVLRTISSEVLPHPKCLAVTR